MGIAFAAPILRAYYSKPTNTVPSSTDLRPETTAFARETFIRPAQRNTFHDNLIVGYSGVLAHHR
ncbi:hypothetical protein CQ10_19065 [Bradyrhizobium valentinum]|nr:hypothetical protein CQ10_19065 [Bradyrhizobium valentinum]